MIFVVLQKEEWNEDNDVVAAVDEQEESDDDGDNEDEEDVSSEVPRQPSPFPKTPSLPPRLCFGPFPPGQ